MTEEEYKEIRSSIDSVGGYFKAIEELTDIRDAIESIDAQAMCLYLKALYSSIFPSKEDFGMKLILSSISILKPFSTSEMPFSEDSMAVSHSSKEK